MEIVRRVQSMKEIARQASGRGLRVGLVPTMGYLHEGHLSLIRQADTVADVVVTSIFVNPTQFGAGEDFDRYPRDLARDVDLCIAEGVDYLFTPEVNDIYPPGPSTWVDVDDISVDFEGRSRPGHFRGVATVVLKLFQIVRPQVAVFGEKDAQQCAVVQRMVRDLMLDVEILVGPIVREEDGLAMSSRNRYLDQEQRAAAAAIPRALAAARAAVDDGVKDADEIKARAREVIEEAPILREDYLEIVHPLGFTPLTRVEDEARLVLAVYCGDTRLLDNTLLGTGAEKD